MFRAIGYLLTEAIWALVHRFLDPYATWPDTEPDTTTPEAVAKWVEQHKQPADPR
jgi:hypothetical protein